MSVGKIEAIYYPLFEPPINWLKTFLLFYDCIRSIVPKDAEFSFSEDIKRLLDYSPESFSFISPSMEDIQIDEIRIDLLERAFLQISQKTKRKNIREIYIWIENGGISIKGYSFLHQNKITKEIKELLEKYNLIDRITSKIFSNEKNYLVVKEEACDLIISNVAYNLSKKYGYPSLTDKELFYSFNSISRLSSLMPTDRKNYLASSVINLWVPEELSSLDIHKYITLRNAFMDLREPFHSFIKNIHDLYALETIESLNVLRERIEALSQEINREYQKFKKTKFIRRFKRWTPIAIGSIFTLAGAAFQDKSIAITSAAVSIAIQVLNESPFLKTKHDQRTELYDLLASLEQKILDKSNIDNYIYEIGMLA